MRIFLFAIVITTLQPIDLGWTIVNIDHIVIDCTHVGTYLLGGPKVLHIDFLIDELVY